MQVENLGKWNIPIAFTLKTLVGLSFLFIYTEFYGTGALSADAGSFMRESKILNDVFYTSPGDYFKFLTGIGDNQELQQQYLIKTYHWDAGAQALINDNKNILRFHSLIHFFSFNNPVIHMFVLCLISTISTRHILIGLSARTELNRNIQFWILILIPSVLFWTSGILKEPLMFLGLGLLIRGLFTKENILKRSIFVALGVLLLLGFKPYIIFAVIPAFFFVAFYTILPKFKIIGALLLLIVLTSTSLLVFSDTREKMVHLITRKQQDFKNIGKGGVFAWHGNGFYYFEPSQFPDLEFEDRRVRLKKTLKATVIDPGGFESPVLVEVENTGEWLDVYFKRDESKGYIEVSQIDDSFSQLLLNIPEAIRNSLLRPFINDPGSWLKYPAMIEVWLVFSILLYAIIKRRKISKDVQLIIVSLTLFIFTLSVIIGLITPVLAAIVRYRIPIFIAIVMIAILILDPHRKKKSHV